VRGNKLVDEAKIPILYARGKHFNRVAGGEIRIPDQGWLRFPVRTTDPANAVMTAVDEAGNRVARYRTTRSVIQNPVIRRNAVYSRTSEEISRHAAEGN